MSYVELHSRSAFSFLRGASAPEQLAEAASSSGMPAMALCDRDGVYGAPRFFAAAKENSVRAIIGSELTMEDGSVLPVLVETRAGYQNLCRLLTRAHLRAPKGESKVRWDELPEFASGLVALTGDEEGPLARVSALGLKSETRYRTLEALPGSSVLEIDLVTGRKNQIRLHAAHAGFPLAGERKYARGKDATLRFRSRRVALHAWKLEFAHPRTGKALRVEAPLPHDLVLLLDRARKG